MAGHTPKDLSRVFEGYINTQMDLIDNLPESVFQEYIDDLLKSASGAVFAGKSRNITACPC